MKAQIVQPLLRNLVAVMMLTFFIVGTGRAADSYPTRPVRIIVPASPGGALDITTRLVAEKMAENLRQSVIVDNRPGAESILGVRLVKDAPPDGYTILAHTSTLTALPALKLNPGFDVLKDFSAIGPAVRAPQVMIVSAELPVHTVSEFIAYAKKNPLSYASAGTGSTVHLGAAMFLLRERLDLLHVPYKGAGAALPDVAGGRVSMMFGGYSGVAPYVQTGKVRALAVTSNKRLAGLPNVPTFTEQGVDYTYYFWVGFLAPAGTPRPVIQRLADALRYAVETKELRDRFVADGSDPWFITSEEFSRYIAKEAAETAKLVTDLNISRD